MWQRRCEPCSKKMRMRKRRMRKDEKEEEDEKEEAGWKKEM